MKKVVIALTLLASVFTQNSFANDGAGVAPEVINAFQNTFAAAKEVSWSTSNDLYKVQFALDGQYITAFYNADGTIAAITRHIPSNQLPVNLQATLKNEYKDLWISELFELSNEDGVAYYVTLENADSKMVLKSSAGTWSFFQKGRKD